jgi:hypothetical protein
VKHMIDLKERDLKRLSAYLDGELNPKEASRLESRLKEEPQLRKALSELNETRKLLRSLPQIRPPRNFSLTPEMVGKVEKRSLYPLFRFATVVATVAFAVLIGTDTLIRSGAGMMQSADQVIEEVEVAVESEVEKIEQAAAAFDEASMTATSEPKLEAPQESLGVEQPQASGAEETVVSEGEAGEITATEEVRNQMQFAPSGTPIPPSEALPEIAPPSEELGTTSEPEPEIPLLQPTSIPDFESESPRIPIEPIHAAEVGLGASAVILALITFFLRRQR